MTHFLRQVFTPLLSLCLITAGNAFLNTLLALRLEEMGCSARIIGLASSAYYAGFIIGSFCIEGFIRRVGHIRAYSFFASIVAVISMLHGLVLSEWMWILFRFLYGVAFAAVFVAIESWLLTLSTINTRGQILSLYMITYYGFQALGQQLLNVGDYTTLVPFCNIAILTSLSVIPLAGTRLPNPHHSETAFISVREIFNLSPSSLFGCICGGSVLAVIYLVLPYSLKDAEFSVKEISWVMTAIILGGMSLQFPIGKLSDHFSRRKVLVVVSIITTILGVALLLALNASFTTLLIVGAVFGGFIFTIYPLSLSHACDLVEHDHLIAVTATLLAFYSMGATIAPLAATEIMHYVGPSGSLYFLIGATGIFSLYMLIRTPLSQSVPVEEQQSFVAVPSRTTTAALELDPRTDEEEYMEDHPHYNDEDE